MQGSIFVHYASTLNRNGHSERALGGCIGDPGVDVSTGVCGALGQKWLQELRASPWSGTGVALHLVTGVALHLVNGVPLHFTFAKFSFTFAFFSFHLRKIIFHLRKIIFDPGEAFYRRGLHFLNSVCHLRKIPFHLCTGSVSPLEFFKG